MKEEGEITVKRKSRKEGEKGEGSM